MNKPLAKLQKARLIISAAIFLLIIFGYFFRDQISDVFSYLINRLDDAAVAVEEDLDLTTRAKIIFSASRPDIETDRDAYNSLCSSYDESVVILGCYASSRIVVYDSGTTEFPGLIQSTTAHELLHAVWDRLSASEKADLKPLLLEVYEQNQDLLSKVMSAYDETEYLEELYARVGTEIAALPPTLEAHYARYFHDQDRIVAFYATYSAPFNAISARLDAISAELLTLKNTLDQENATYSARYTQFSRDVDSFNSCAAIAGCFTSRYTFNLQRSQLLAEQSYLNALYDSIDQHINTYNQLVSEYNSSILRSQNLQDLINSNAPPAEMD